MIDFPASPTTGQIFTAAGASWRYDGTKWVAYGSGSTNAGRNLIHNPILMIGQRTGPWTTNGYTADRWQAEVVLDTISFSFAAITDAQRTAIGDEQAAWALQNVFTGNAGVTAYNRVQQPIEDVRRLAGKTVTVSFYAVAAAGTPKVGVSFSQVFGTGGSPSAQVNVAAQSVTLSTTYARYSLAFAIPSISGKTLGTAGNDCTRLHFWYSSGTNNNVAAGSIGVQSGTIQFWGVQLEIGSAATPLEKPDPQQDLARCQRFFQTGTAWAYYSNATGGTGYVGNTYSLSVTMRASPTIVSMGVPSNSNIGPLTMGVVGPPYGFAVGVFGTPTANGLVAIYNNFTASADL